MNKVTASFVFLCATFTMGACAEQGKTNVPGANDLREAARLVEHASKKNLGLSLGALSILLRGHSDTSIYLSKSSLRSDEEAAIKELSLAGYAEVSEIPSAEGPLVVISFTQTGRELLTYLVP